MKSTSLPPEKKVNYSAPFTRYDFCWVLLCIGMAVGAGTVLMPIQIGMKGIWVFILSFIIAYPATYLLQSLYLKTLQESEECEDYTNIISQYLGKNWGIFLGIIYFIMLVHGMFIYSTSVVNDSASYLHTFGITQTLLSDNILYRFMVLGLLVLVSAKGEHFIFKISSPMITIKIGIIVTLGMVMIPHWNMNNIRAFPELRVFFRDVLLTIPFIFFSAVFVQVLNPMNIAYRKREKDKLLATYLAIRTHRIAYITLIIIILFFSLSFTFSISYDQAVEAFNDNISALAIAAKVIPGDAVKIMSLLLNIFAVITAFLGIYLGFQEAVKGIIINFMMRFMPKEQINGTILHISICLFITVLLTAWVSTGFSMVIFFHIASPIYAIVTCFVPCYLVYNVASLKQYKGWKTVCVLAFGLLLFISPFFKIFE